MESQLCLCFNWDTRAGSSNNVCLGTRVSKKNTSIFICKWKTLSRGWTFVGWMMNFSKLLASAVKVAHLSLTILFNWQQPPREFISNICSPYYSNDHCQSWWISVCIIDLKIWERDRLSMHHWRNSLVLWANPLGALIRIKCLSHLFSVDDRNNESLNIVFQRNPSPSWPKDIWDYSYYLLFSTKVLHQIRF